jgi:hypothetical protein
VKEPLVLPMLNRRCGAVLDGLEVVDPTVAGVPFREAIAAAYGRLITPGEADMPDLG